MIQLAALAEDWARSDPRVLAAQRSWSACMRRRGAQTRRLQALLGGAG